MVIDLNSRRRTPTSFTSLAHPAGVTLPFEGPADAELLLPEIRSRIVSGAYCAELLGLLAETVAPGDRVLVIGAGLGTVSALAPSCARVQRVIAIEPNTELFPYMQRTHRLNGASSVESINAVIAPGAKGLVPYFARHDIRLSSPLADDCSWQLPMMVPSMDLNLILSEERISLLVCEVPVGAAAILAHADLDQVDRVLVGSGDDTLALGDRRELATLLEEKGFAAESGATTLRAGRRALDAGTALRASDRA